MDENTNDDQQDPQQRLDAEAKKQNIRLYGLATLAIVGGVQWDYSSLSRP